MSKILLILSCLLIFTLITETTAHARSKKSKKSENTIESGDSDSFSDSSPSTRLKAMMYTDLTAQYVRPISSTGGSDSALRFSIGGMFDSLFGLDALGLFESKSKSFLIGADIRIAPTNWLFFKGGFGGYADKKSKEFKGTPLASSGILAPLSQSYYFTSEISYFEVDSRSNIAIGAGLGVIF